MFSSSNTFPSSTHGFPPTSAILFSQEKDGVYFNHFPFVIGSACSFPPPIKESSGLLQNSDNNLILSDSLISPSRKRVAVSSKKDRHSKIFTAHGPRDRRVRLSIDISKKFFGLQDLLGFDKASKTLDWLFTKSKIAIKDLVEEMKHTSSSTLSDQFEQVFMEKGDHLEKKGKKKKPVANKCVKRKKKTTQKQKSGFHVNVGARNHLRTEARTRARVRTIEKLRIKKLNNDVKNVLGDSNCCYLQSTCGNQVQSQSNHEVKFGELFVEQRLPKPYSLIYNSQNYVTQKIQAPSLRTTPVDLNPRKDSII